MAKNYVQIKVYPNKIEVWPPCPEVVAGVEPLTFAIYWDDDPGTWESVAVGEFIAEDGTKRETIEPGPVFPRHEKNVAKAVNFKYLAAQDEYCKYDLICTPSGNGDPFIVDPTIRIRKLG